MNLATARLGFLAFVGLTGSIIYNALYLQEPHSTTGPTPIALPTAQPAESAPAATGTAVAPAVRTDLPPLPGQEVPEQLVKAVQRELDARGYDAGPSDGKLRDQTRKAISAFQKDHGLGVTGKPSDDLLRQILLGETAKDGTAATGAVAPRSQEPAKTTSTVKAVQEILADLGYEPGQIDGNMGDATARAISAFQRDRKIAATGTISSELLREIKRVTGRNLAEAGAASP
jgi:peptidoglycan hydrolase-like protein with peptidoglycan-binding domain